MIGATLANSAFFELNAFCYNDIRKLPAGFAQFPDVDETIWAKR
jgi:hypothetical protein